MDGENNKQDNLKIVFSLISLLLMVPQLMTGDTGYYRTIFIFLINRVIDMFFKKRDNESTFFVVWSLTNQWLGVVVCAVAFSLIAPDFAEICNIYSKKINMVIFAAAISCVLKEMTVLVVQSVKEQLIKQRIQSEVRAVEGE